ncbi:MAG TPA: LysM domain-containing protein [Dermatophilaceae bacterium]|nr:LysM domain-containing protein [Dermatophilaceae bacterium]HMT89808.1 LysM domain-containing protein [Dermatophilaceae bacterium]
MPRDTHLHQQHHTGPRTLGAAMRGVAVTLLGVSAATALAWGLGRFGAQMVTLRSWEAARPEDLLAGGCALVGAALGGWLALGTALSALAQLPGAVGAVCRSLAHVIAPAALRRTVAFLLGTSLVAAVVPGTAAAATIAPAVGTRHTLVLDAPGPLALDPGFHPPTDTSWTPLDPDRPLPEWATAPTSAAGTTTTAQPVSSTPAATSREYVVQRGDSLWSIAARHLGPHATTAQIAAAWPQWYAANAQTVGSDPDQITPGQRLVVPTQVTEAVR